jgi:hypothetical protein
MSKEPDECPLLRWLNEILFARKAGTGGSGLREFADPGIWVDARCEWTKLDSSCESKFSPSCESKFNSSCESKFNSSHQY